MMSPKFSRDDAAAEGFQCDKAAVLADTLKQVRCMG
jgi:hypothetical protein